MNNLSNIFSTREIAIFIWFLILLIFAIRTKEVRNSIVRVIKAFFNRKLFLAFCTLLIYILLVVFILSVIGFWDISLLKDTVFWTLFSGIVLKPECQIEHGQFIYSLPPEERNDYRQIFQFRMLNARQQYINVSSRQQVIETDRNGKAWIIMGVMDILPDQTPIERIKRTVVNRKTGEMLPTCTVSPDKQLSNREKEILRLIRQGFLSKEIAYQLGVSIYTVNNHRKNILSKLDANNIMEAIHIVENLGIYL